MHPKKCLKMKAPTIRCTHHFRICGSPSSIDPNSKVFLFVEVDSSLVVDVVGRMKCAPPVKPQTIFEIDWNKSIARIMAKWNNNV